MVPNHPQFLDAIAEKNLIRIEFYSKPDEGVIDRECAPLDYGPVVGEEGSQNRYWIWDYKNSSGANPLGLVPEQIVSVRVLGSHFIPQDLRLGPRKWSVPREWGIVTAEIIRPAGIELPKEGR
jgi:hypothetical protein